jgi:hypothetical protein
MESGLTVAIFPTAITQRAAFGRALRARRMVGDGQGPHKVDWCCAVTGYCRKQWYNWESGAQLPRYEAILAIKRIYPDIEVYLTTP